MGGTPNSNQERRLIPKSWTDFQHYKDRAPPWIKFHRSLLNDRTFMRLPLASKALAPLLWLLASESKSDTGEFDASQEELEFRLHMTSKDIQAGLQPLLDSGFFIEASNPLASCLQTAPQRREEGEEEKQKKTTIRSATVEPPTGVSLKTWTDFQRLRKAKRSPLTETALDGIRVEADKAGYTLEQALSTCCLRGWQGFEADWVMGKAAPRQVGGMLPGAI